MPLETEPDNRPPADRHPAELVRTLVPARLGAPLPLALNQHLPSTSVVGYAAFGHQEFLLDAAQRGKPGAPQRHLTALWQTHPDAAN